MLITCLQYRIDKKSSYSEMVYTYLLIGCKHNLPNLVSFILKNFKVDYLIFQEKDECLDVCTNNDCFQIFLDHPNTREITLNYWFQKISNKIYNLNKRKYDSLPCKLSKYVYNEREILKKMKINL